MKRLAALVAIAAVTLLGVHLLQQSTEYRGSAGRSGQSTLIFGVKTRGYHHSDSVAATTLWQSCVDSLSWTSVTGPVPAGPHLYRATIRPSLSADTDRRLRGCLDGSTIDSVEGHVEGVVSRL